MKKTSCQATLPSPVVALLARFAERIDQRGYRKTTTDQYVSICRKFSAFIARRRIRVEDIREHDVKRFLSAALAGRRGLRQGGRLTTRFWRKPLLLLLAHLRDEGLIPPAEHAPLPLAPGLADYLTFLREHRGLCARTVNRHRRHVAQFVGDLPARTEQDLRRITIEHVDQHLVRTARRLGRQSIGLVCASLRGFLGHLHLRGILPTDLREQVILPHIYPLEAMPHAVAWKEIERTLATVDRSTTLGCRDYAILVLISYCGLRAGDVAALRLGDIDWRRDVLAREASRCQ